MAFYDYDLTEQVKGKHELSKMALSQNKVKNVQDLIFL